jgi:hypothetical protein
MNEVFIFVLPNILKYVLEKSENDQNISKRKKSQNIKILSFLYYRFMFFDPLSLLITI